MAGIGRLGCHAHVSHPGPLSGMCSNNKRYGLATCSRRGGPTSVAVRSFGSKSADPNKATHRAAEESRVEPSVRRSLAARPEKRKIHLVTRECSRFTVYQHTFRRLRSAKTRIQIDLLKCVCVCVCVLGGGGGLMDKAS